MSPLLEPISVILCPNNAKLVGCGMGMGFALTWLRQVSPPASHDHFNHWDYLLKFLLNLTYHVQRFFLFPSYLFLILLSVCRAVD